MKILRSISYSAIVSAGLLLAACSGSSGSGPATSASARAETSAPAASATVAAPGAPASAAPTGSGQAPAFMPPPDSAIPDNEFGAVVRKGQAIFMNTHANAPEYVGNGLNCVNCHLDAGRRADSAPLWGAWVMYPAYRSKNKHVNTFAERLQGCFKFSMNGKAPPADSEVIVALESYAYWMAKGAPTGIKLAGALYPDLPKPALAPSYERGEKVFQSDCALCHGGDGQGQKVAGKYVFPPLWGPDSFNWGAGMQRVNTAAGFIKANMPFSRGGTLTDQDAWDVALYMDSHERPQDPRFTGNVEQTRKQFHAGEQSMYGVEFNGYLLGSEPLKPRK